MPRKKQHPFNWISISQLAIVLVVQNDQFIEKSSPAPSNGNDNNQNRVLALTVKGIFDNHTAPYSFVIISRKSIIHKQMILTLLLMEHKKNIEKMLNVFFDEVTHRTVYILVGFTNSLI